MTDIIDKYENEATNSKNEILSNYKDLMVNYEKTRQVYEDTINPADIVPTNVIHCSHIVAYNRNTVVISWEIMRLDGTILYSSAKNLKFDSCHIDLSVLNLNISDRLKLVSNLGGSDYYTNVEILEYIPDYATVYYEYDYKSSTIQHIWCIGFVQSVFYPPVLKCCGLIARNDASVRTEWDILSADTGKILYTSGKYNTNSNFKKDFGTLNIEPGTNLRLHAAVVGKDSFAPIIFEYDPSLSTFAKLILIGNAFKTSIVFDGTTSLLPN